MIKRLAIWYLARQGYAVTPKRSLMTFSTTFAPDEWTKSPNDGTTTLRMISGPAIGSRLDFDVKYVDTYGPTK